MKKVLIVDDDLIVLHSLYLLLEKDYRVEGLSDGKQALNRIRENSYDLIITDLFLNDVTGLDLYWAAKNKENVIIITAYPEKELAIKAKSLLGDRFIPKSTSPEILKSKVAAILGI
mgnify:CR=1 FL=1